MEDITLYRIDAAIEMTRYCDDTITDASNSSVPFSMVEDIIRNAADRFGAYFQQAREEDDNLIWDFAIEPWLDDVEAKIKSLIR